MALYCELDSLKTESDVEQKFIYQFLSSEQPIGLGLKDAEILTKHLLKKRIIDKGQKQQYYYPDYLITIRGIPSLVVEAKAPNVSLAQGYSEARLYAQEVNASYSHKLNTCQFILASNGKETWFGYFDQAEPIMKLDYSDFSTENKLFCDLVSHCSRRALLSLANKLYADSRGNAKFSSPVSMLGGKRVQNEEMVENSFGRILVLENRAIFDPETEEDRAAIVENAYIASPKREQHVDPIYKEIKRFELPSQRNTTDLSTEQPEELIEMLSEKVLNNQNAYSLMLLIGNVGSGKTTFIRYFKNVFLRTKHNVLYNKCEWIFINMNLAPISHDEVYSWLKTQIVTSIKNNHSDIDFDDYSVIKRVFRREIQRFSKGIGSLLIGDKTEFNKELYTFLSDKIQNTDVYLSALLFFIKENYAKIPIIVLDNCDKRNKDEQLLMFEVSQWLRTAYKCIVILPMRDTTYDMYKSEPPLDTVVRDLVFRIDPPDLLKVLQARLDYITRISDLSSNTYDLDNSMHVSIDRQELIDYFKYIMVAIRKDRWISEIFYRLANRNTRNGIQIFEDFCKSGHMRTDDIWSIRVLGEEARVPTYRFINVLLRKNRRYYNGNESNFVNLFYSNYNDDFPDPFARVDILNWLYSKRTVEGPTGDKGLLPSLKLTMDLQVKGHNIDVLHRELQYLIKRGLVFCENSVGIISDNDLIKLLSPGLLHLRMLSNIEYLAACAEDTLFKNTEIMMRISNRLKNKEENSILVSTLNAKDLLNYLAEYKKSYLIDSSDLLTESETVKSFDLNNSYHVLEQWVQANPNLAKTLDEIDRHKEGAYVDANVISKKNGGIVCRINNGTAKGFVSVIAPRYNLDRDTYNSIRIGDIIHCCIMDYDIKHCSFQLRFIRHEKRNYEQEP